jgi:hypothetical protein
MQLPPFTLKELAMLDRSDLGLGKKKPPAKPGPDYVEPDESLTTLIAEHGSGLCRLLQVIQDLSWSRSTTRTLQTESATLAITEMGRDENLRYNTFVQEFAFSHRIFHTPVKKLPEYQPLQVQPNGLSPVYQTMSLAMSEAIKFSVACSKAGCGCEVIQVTLSDLKETSIADAAKPHHRIKLIDSYQMEAKVHPLRLLIGLFGDDKDIDHNLATDLVVTGNVVKVEKPENLKDYFKYVSQVVRDCSRALPISPPPPGVTVVDPILK